MKNIVCFLLFACTMASCINTNKNIGRYDVVGVATDSTYNGLMVDLIIPLVDGVQDSTMIVDGKFRLKGNLPTKTPYQIRVRNKKIITLSTEEREQVNVTFETSEHKVTSGANSMAISDMFKEMNDLSIRFMMVTRNIPDDEIIDREHQAFRSQTIAILDKCIEENSDNIVGVYGVWQKATFLKLSTISALDSLVAKVPMANNCAVMMAMRKNIEYIEASQPGNMFVDINAKDIDDNEVKLSDYVGNGKYVLATFWTSWSGPCWEEIPYLKENYVKYGDKGLMVLNINVWDKKNHLVPVIKNEELNWDMIFSLDNNDATKLYGVQTMPTLILFGPDGIIINRTIQGAQTGELLKEIFGE